MRYAFQIFWCALVVASGCSSGSDRGTPDQEFARMNEDERIRMCTKYFRDAKTSCREGLQDESASTSYECLSVRIKLDRNCLAPR